MSRRRSRNEQQPGDDFEDLVCRFLKAVDYTQIEKHPKIGTKRADLLYAYEKPGAGIETLATHPSEVNERQIVKLDHSTGTEPARPSLLIPLMSMR